MHESDQLLIVRRRRERGRWCRSTVTSDYGRNRAGKCSA